MNPSLPRSTQAILCTSPNSLSRCAQNIGSTPNACIYLSNDTVVVSAEALKAVSSRRLK